MRRFPVLLLAALPLLADPAAERRSAQPDVFALVELAVKAPPEFGADALVRLVEKGRVKDPLWQRELVDQAFALAGQAREALPRRTVPGLPVDAALAGPPLEIDRLSLQARAVFQMVKLDEERAEQMFREVPRPEPRVLSCADATYDDPSPYVAMLRVFGSAEDKVAFIAGIRSHSELAPAATLAEEEVVRQAFGPVLQRLTGEERLFTALIPGTLAALGPLQLGDPLGEYVGHNLATEACAESGREGPQRKARAEAAKAFSLDPKPPSTAGAAALNPGPQQDPAIQEQFQSLMFGKNRTGITEQHKRSAEWQDQFVAFLARIESDRPGFHQRAQLLSAAYLAAPAGTLRDRVLEGYLTFLTQSELQTERPLEWYAEAAALPSVALGLPGEYGKVLALYTRTGHPVLVLLARLQEIGA